MPSLRPMPRQRLRHARTLSIHWLLRSLRLSPKPSITKEKVREKTMEIEGMAKESRVNRRIGQN